jgi:hypothetical protein
MKLGAVIDRSAKLLREGNDGCGFDAAHNWSGYGKPAAMGRRCAHHSLATLFAAARAAAR